MRKPATPMEASNIPFHKPTSRWVGYPYNTMKHKHRPLKQSCVLHAFVMLQHDQLFENLQQRDMHATVKDHNTLTGHNIACVQRRHKQKTRR